MASQDKRRSSLFGKLFQPRSPVVWEVQTEEDLGLDVSPVRTSANAEQKRRVKTLERRSGEDDAEVSSQIDRRKTIGGSVELNGSQISLFTARSHGSAYSASTARSNGSTYSNESRSRLMEGVPPISPLALPSGHSVTSSERSSSRRHSHIQLVPRSMLPAESVNVQSEEMKRYERELQVLGARERRVRGLSTSSADGDRPPSRSGDEIERPKSDASSNGGGVKVRIQYVPRSSLPQTGGTEPEYIPMVPPKPIPEFKTRLRSLTSVTEETRIQSDNHSDIEEEDGEVENSESKQ